MEMQTLQQETSVYHVCQQCSGAGCPVCADLCIVPGDLMPINRVIGINSVPYRAGEDNPDVFCVYCGALGYHTEDCLYATAQLPERED